MKAGFARVDITPRLGVELSGFGPYRHRYAREIRDNLYARAMAVADGSRQCILISADLIGVDAETVRQAREMLHHRTGLPPQCLMFHATHTHSGPATVRDLIGWGEPDGPYLARLPHLLARAGREALQDLRDVEFSHAEVPVEGISYNRELERRPTYEEALRDDWRPRHPERTDTTGRIIRAAAGGRIMGFLACFSCHPVVCCEGTHSVHGDYCGVAMGKLEAEHSGAVALFLQGAHGDLNTCACHMPQAESMRALDVIAERFARSVRRGLAAAKPLPGASVSAVLHRVTFRRRTVTGEQLRADIDSYERTIREAPDGDADRECRMATVFLTAARNMLQRLESGGSMDTTTQMQALRFGELLILGTPFELFRGIGGQVRRAVGHEPLLVLSTTNDFIGYAVTRDMCVEEGAASYAQEQVPLMLGTAPFCDDLEDDIVRACVRLAGEVRRETST